MGYCLLESVRKNWSSCASLFKIDRMTEAQLLCDWPPASISLLSLFSALLPLWAVHFLLLCLLPLWPLPFLPFSSFCCLSASFPSLYSLSTVLRSAAKSLFYLPDILSCLLRSYHEAIYSNILKPKQSLSACHQNLCLCTIS